MHGPTLCANFVACIALGGGTDTTILLLQAASRHRHFTTTTGSKQISARAYSNEVQAQFGHTVLTSIALIGYDTVVARGCCCAAVLAGSQAT